ncbi:MAG: Hint domain-containing protein [Oligoflexales bacterium]
MLKSIIKNSLNTIIALQSTLSLAGGFLEGTLIRKPHGQYAFVEDVQAGDTVIACNDGVCKLGRVAGTTEPTEALTIHITTGTNKIIAAEDQTFLVDGKWVEARNIRIGDIIAGQEEVKRAIKGDVETVYGFEVEEYHNFFANSCLAHNMPYGLGQGMYGQAQGSGTTKRPVAINKDTTKGEQQLAAMSGRAVSVTKHIADKHGQALAISTCLGCGKEVFKHFLEGKLAGNPVVKGAKACYVGALVNGPYGMVLFEGLKSIAYGDTVDINHGRQCTSHGDTTYSRSEEGVETSDNWHGDSDIAIMCATCFDSKK